MDVQAHEVIHPRYSVWGVTRFYVPLMLLAFSQSLTYPLVAGVASHGPMGVNALTAFTQGQMVMFMIESVAGGMVMTGMVYAKALDGYLSFRRLNNLMVLLLLAIQALCVVHPFDTWIFGSLFNLPPEMTAVARGVLFWSLPIHAGFLLRIVPTVVLFNNLESGKASIATFVRVFVTLGLAQLLLSLNAVGPYWALFALTAGVFIETFLTWLYARPYTHALFNSVPATVRDSSAVMWKKVLVQLRFTMPLSLGYFLLLLSPLMIAAFVGRSQNATDMLAIHYVTIGVANPIAYAALRMQAVSIQFPPEGKGDHRLLHYAIVAGLLLGLIPLLFSLPVVGDWYFGAYQNVPERLIPTARLAIGIYAAISVIHAVRARIEGIAAVHKQPMAVMAGQISYTVGLLATLAILLPLGCPGWAMAVAAIFVAPICVTLAIYTSLRLKGL